MTVSNGKANHGDSSRAISSCGSPIEVALVEAMFRIWTFDSYDMWSNGRFSNNPLTLWFDIGDYDQLWLAIQVKFTCLGERRADFVASSMTSPLFIVELDGVEYHSSREALIADRKKDRVAAANGIQTIRFAGPEIAMDPEGAAREIYAIAKAADDREYDTREMYRKIYTETLSAAQ